MSAEIKVQSTSGAVSPKQFAGYRNGPITSKRVAIGCLILFGLLLIPLLMSGPPQQDDVTAKPVEVPTISAEVQKEAAQFAQYKVGQDLAPAARGGTRFYAAPKVVARPLNVKVPPGSMVSAKLLSGGSNGAVRAQTTQPLSINGETLIENGAFLLGEGSSTEERLYISFSQVILKDGSFFGVQAQAADFEDKIVGLKGSKVGHYAMRLGAGIGLNFVAGLSEGLQEQDVVQGAVIKKHTLKNALLNGAQMAAIEESRETMTKLRSKQPIIEVNAGKEIYVIFNGTEK